MRFGELNRDLCFLWVTRASTEVQFFRINRCIGMRLGMSELLYQCSGYNQD